MRNHILPVFLIIIQFSTQAFEKTEVFRFNRLLRQYNNPVYRAYDRDLLLNAEYSSLRNDAPKYDSEPYWKEYFEQNYSLDFTGKAGFIGLWTFSRPYTQSEHNLSVHLQGQIFKKVQIRTEDFLGYYDTSKSLIQSATGKLIYDGSIRRYLLPNLWHNHVFVEATGSINTEKKYSRNRTFNHNNHADEIYRSTFDRENDFAIKTKITPAIGSGKRLPVAPVYKAFEIERKLRKLRIIDSKLSSSSIMKIATLCGSLKSFRISHDRPDKFILSTLDSILRCDPAIDTTLYDSFSLYNAYETFEERFPLLFHGFEIKLHNDFELVYNYLSLYPDQTHSLSEFKSNWNSMNFLQLAWTLPVTSRLFIEYSVNPPILPTFDGLRHYSSFDGLLHYGLFKLYFFFTNRILLDASVNDFSTYLIIP
ncbi:MAG TPA: hypothetical protein VHO70_24100 [Chitinispirillaceae bacterium]|nr:hypothetical protein [Chitinispirillaceae bacterium]